MKRYLGFLALFLIIAFPATTSAHQGNSNYRSEIKSIQPSRLADGLSFSVVNFDDHVRLESSSDEIVLIRGYDGEPLARVLPDGTVEENLNSPSYYLNQDRFAEVDLPDRADERAPPEWKRVGDNGIYEWHDHRSHYMSEGLPPQVEDESKVTKVFDYSIPIEVGDRSARVNGTLTWVGSDSQVPVVPLAILTVALVGGIGFWLLRRRRREEKEAW